MAVPTEDRLVSKALELLENDTYWAGIVFENLGPIASEAPPYVKYKIRMDIDEVEDTKKLKDRYVLVAPITPGKVHQGLCTCRAAGGRSQGVKSCLTVLLVCRLKVTNGLPDLSATSKTNQPVTCLRSPRLWVPGARDSAYKDLPYVRGGFAYLQDMMDQGIIRAQTLEAAPLGVYAQQMPYPCYVDDG